MMHRRSRHRRRANFAVRGQHLLDRTESPAAEFARHRVGAVKIRIDHAHQSNRFALLFQFFVDARVVASEDAHPHHRDGNRIVSLQEGLSAGWLPAGTTNCKRKAGKEHLEEIE